MCGDGKEGDHECGVGPTPAYTELNQQLGRARVKEHMSGGQDWLPTCLQTGLMSEEFLRPVYHNFSGPRTLGLGL